MDVWFWVLVAVYSLNFLLMISMIFLERRKVTSVISWMAILTVLPIVGYIFYATLGSGLSIRTRRLINNHKLYEQEHNDEIKKILKMQDDLQIKLGDNKNIIQCLYSYGSLLCPGNDIQVFLWGQDKIEALKKDLQNAKESINMEYYIFADDKVGKEIMDILIAKAREGVKVKFIYDSIGCLGAPRRFFRKLRKAGGEVAEFFPPLFHIRMLNLKMNYRNHRKIVVIDGKIGYTGGINIRDDHMGLNKKVSPWRDTHIRIEGSGVYILQNIFLNDFRYCKKENKKPEEYVNEGYFPKVQTCGDVSLQVLASGPDNEVQIIKEAYIKLITNAKNRVFIQSPYFVPDESFISAIRIALASGVKVGIMIPSKPDHRSVFYVSLSYLKELMEEGVDVYLYKGFLHSKVLLVDDDKISIGTCNTDNRSFGLNFEDTVVMYSKKINQNYYTNIEDDIAHSQKIDEKYFKRKRWYTKFLQAIFRLGSPIL